MWLNRAGVFNDEYDKARANGERWTRDARETALRVAGYPNPDKVEPTRVDVTQSNGLTTILVLAENLQDDSIEARETRVDLVRNDDGWVITWAGERWRCARDALTGWKTSLCS